MKKILSLIFAFTLVCSVAFATVTDQTQRVQYTATASQTVFAYTWRVLDDGDMDVFVDGVLTTAYSVSNVGVLAGGNVTFNTGRISGEIITILRNMPNSQETSYPAGGRLSTVNLELNLDRLTMFAQDLAEEIGRATKFPGSSTLKNIDYPIGTSAANRANKIALWNSAGDNLVLGTIGISDIVSLITTKGDLLHGNGSGSAARLPIGNEGEIVTVVSGNTSYAQSRNVAWSKGTDIAGTAALAIPDEDANYFDVTGTPTVTSIAAANLDVGSLIRVHFDTIGTLTHHATNLVLPDSSNITVSVGDEFTFIQYATDDYRLVSTTSSGALPLHTHADNDNGGNTLTIPTIGDFTNATHDHTNAAGGGSISAITLGTEQASTSGTAITFSSIPSGTKKITIMVAGVSTDGTEELLVKLGDAGGPEDSGYFSAVTTASATVAATDGFLLNTGAAAAGIYHGAIILFLENSASFTWVANSNISRSDAADSFCGAGSKSLTAELDRVVITTTGTPDDFDEGVINIQYE